MSTFKQKTSGVAHLTDPPMAKPLVLSAAVGAKATTGKLIRKRGPDETESRTAGDNVIILRYWAKHGRNVVFLDDGDERKGAAIWKRACEARIAGRELALMHEAEKVSQVQISTIHTHVQQGRRQRGRIKPLKEGTIKRKERETGKKNQPVLVRTGKLMESLIPYVRKIKG